MDRWSNHQFAASSAQQYLWLEKLYPDAFERVKTYVKDNRFHPVGGAWLEHDSNLPCGESLVRQYLYGQRYFKSRFGEYCREAWLPDTFGYASQLPQILRQAGMKYFFTQKASRCLIYPLGSDVGCIAILEQHHRLPVQHVQLDRSRWICCIGSSGPS
jgi:alpha-mannosidase